MKSPGIKAIFRIFLLFAFLTALNLSPFIFTGALPGAPGCDTIAQFIPFYSFGVYRMAQGAFPQIVPIFSSHDIASFGQGFVYPTFFLGILLAIPVVPFFLFDLWLHWAFAGLSMSLYCLRIRLRLIPALLAGCVYIFSAPVMWRLWGHWTFIHQIAFYPLVLVLTEELIHPRWFKSRTRLVGFGGLIAGLLLLAQNIQILYYLCLALIPYFIIRLVCKRDKKKFWIPLLMGSGVFLLALLFASAYFLPILTSFKSSFRYLLKGSGFANSFSLEFPHLYSLLYPGFFFCDKAYWGKWYAGESMISIGFAVIFTAYLGIAGILCGRSRIRLLAPGLFFLVAAILGFGREVPWFDFLVRRLPLYSSLRSHGRVSFLIVIALAILFAEGFAMLLQIERVRRRRKIFWIFSAGGAFLLLLFSIFVLYRFTSYEHLVSWLRKWNFTPPGFGSGSADSRNLVLKSLRNSVLPVALFSFIIFLLSLPGIFKPVFERPFTYLVCAVLLSGFLSDFLFIRHLILGSKSPSHHTVFPERIDKKLREISALTPDPGRFCIVSHQPFQILNLLYPRLEAASGLDGNFSLDYGYHLNIIQGLPPNAYQLGTHFAYLNSTILDDLAIRWILVERSLLKVMRLSPDMLKTAADADDFLLMEYLGWKGKVMVDGTGSMEGIYILQHAPDYVSMKVSGSGSKSITLKNVHSPYWRAYFQGKSVPWVKKGPWMNVNVVGEGVLEFRFCNNRLWVGICLSCLGAVLIVILLAFPRRNKKKKNISAI
ncbi:hypothetical protein JW926_10265 [Candidatus Sumerlaeota bacterium]|nr:hypothetical protein [Candidatus Sumerlaeota bacterium]